MGICAGLLAASLLRQAPEIPGQTASTTPSAQFLRAVSLGHDSAAATLLWTSIVASYAQRTASPSETVAAVRTCGHIDTSWSTPWAYGATIVRSLGDVEGHEALLQEAMAVHPDEYWFPYMLGMSRYLNHGDRAGAADYLEAAADLPGGTEVHRRAARAIRHR